MPPGREAGMKSSRAVWAVSALIVILGLAVSAQISTLFGKLKNRERTIRLLSAEVRRRAAAPISAGLTNGESRVFSLRIRLRAKDKEIKELVSRLILRGQELDSARGKLGDGKKTVRALRESLNESEKNLSGLRAEKGKLEERLASLIARQTRAMAGKENEIASLDKKNKALLRSVEKLKRSARILERKNMKLAQPRLPKELREKLKEFGAK
ncbi:MAG TPA: hypothetical protein DDZ83_14810 [Nitrospinae bacterium]|nr:hypothetical protein [Nitrospinota bacterium]